MLKGKRLVPGMRIGVISPASSGETPWELARAKEYLEQLGYQVELGSHVDQCRGFVSAPEQARAEDLNEMFAREDIDAVFCTRGGYGSAQIIRHIDFDSIRRHPKIFTGFSDITSLHLAINKFAGLVSFHACGMSRFNSEDLTEYTEKQFFKAVSGEGPLGLIPLADPKKYLYTISGGKAEGELIGGNITLLCASMGTAYQPDTRGKILLLEEVDAEPWVVDNSMSHLRNAGVFDGVKGIVIGECKGCQPLNHNPGYYVDLHVAHVFDYYFKDLGVPVLYGLPLGHTQDMAALPLGVQVRLDGDQKTFEVLEQGTC